MLLRQHGRRNAMLPYQYPTTLTTTKVAQRFVYARNASARITGCPCLLRAVVRNATTPLRVSGGPLRRGRNVRHGAQKHFREYADSVADGLVEYYSKARGLYRDLWAAQRRVLAT